MLIAVRAEVESVDHWREKFKTHVELFKSQGVSVAHMGAANDRTAIAIFETNDPDEFVRIFNDPATAEAMAEEVGQQYGQAMAAGMQGDDLAAGHKSLRAAMQAVADALTAHGFAAHTDQRNNQLRIVNNHCPFGDVAIEHPVICAVDRGMVKGMLTAIYGDTSPETSASLPQGDTFCATTI